MSEKMTRVEFQRLMRRRVRAVDLALAAMIATVERELPDDPALIRSFRTIAANIRTRLSASYGFARDALRGGEGDG